MRIETQNTEKPILTDEEVWLSAYCAAISTGGYDNYDAYRIIAQQTLKDFKERFRKND